MVDPSGAAGFLCARCGSAFASLDERSAHYRAEHPRGPKRVVRSFGSTEEKAGPASPALCSCGVLAIGRCGVCDGAFCVSHLRLLGLGQGVCADCARRRSDQHERDVRREQAARPQRISGGEALDRLVRRFLSEMRAAGNPGQSSYRDGMLRRGRCWFVGGERAREVTVNLAVTPDGLTSDRYGPPFGWVSAKNRPDYQDAIVAAPKIKAVAKGMARVMEEQGLDGDPIRALGADLAVRVAPLS